MFFRHIDWKLTFFNVNAFYIKFDNTYMQKSTVLGKKMGVKRFLSVCYYI